jgi:alpha-L-fucosidase
MYATDLSRWNAVRMGPKRDVIKELSDAVRAQSMIPGASSHRAEHWWFFNGGMKFDSDVRDPEFADFYGPAQREEIRPSEAFLEDWLARTVELVEHNDPQLVWFDWWIEQDVFQPWLAKFAAWYYNRASPATVRWRSTTSSTPSRPVPPSTTSNAGRTRTSGRC